MAKLALLSVYNKDGIVEFAKSLIELGFSIISSGGTAKCLQENGVETSLVADLVGGGPILGHRVVTLSREIHAALLATEKDSEELAELGIPRIDLVCVDLYPLQDEIDRPGATLESIIEMTDIGGPCMLRSAAKGNRIVISDFAQRVKVLKWLKDGEPNPEFIRNSLAIRAEEIVAYYCLVSAKARRDHAPDFD
ncbi:MAG: hypothetical protein WC227_01485 [Patescibacteria group bacterium]|jgi:phosphoribosylaminoimidazolecarboxamide formyltransferase/IMP cyclohydrolase